jgi:bacterial leucyl aminopeptidase
VRAIAANRSDITVTQFVHSNFNQRSLIARFAGREPTLPVVILGAHQDSINSNNPSGGRSPGADDDGSGSITLVETLRVLLENNFYPRHPFEVRRTAAGRAQARARVTDAPHVPVGPQLQWYAAEEIGLVGSAAIASAYRADDIPVYAMLQLGTRLDPLPSLWRGACD